jgi:uncharacterized glyoxalase superfamily protein PhnB
MKMYKSTYKSVKPKARPTTAKAKALKQTIPRKSTPKTNKLNGSVKADKKSQPKSNKSKPRSTSTTTPAPEIMAFGHVSINVNNLEEAAQHYFELFGAKPFQKFPHYNSKECALGQGFLDGKLDMDVCHIMIPKVNVMIELFKYNVPKMEAVKYVKKPFQTGLVSHCAMRIADVCKEYQRLKTVRGVRLLNNTPGFTPKPLGAFSFDKMIIPDPAKNNMEYKENLMKTFANIRFLYFVDRYNCQWELEQSDY